MKRLCVLISGNGSNLQALLDAACDDGMLPHVRVVQVLSNRADALGISRALRSGVDAHVLTWDKATHDRQAYDALLAQAVNDSSPDLVVLAGFMHIVGPDFLNALSCPAINLHPALPGSYIGMGAIEQGFADWQAGRVLHHGVMVHHVVMQVDRGSVIAQESIEPCESDTLMTFSEKMHSAERKALLRAVYSLT